MTCYYLEMGLAPADAHRYPVLAGLMTCYYLEMNLAPADAHRYLDLQS
jgi:hypothetical protein